MDKMADDQPQVITAVSLKLPNFWPSDPELWFVKVEASFRNRNPAITVDSTKFDHILGVLPPEVCHRVRHVLMKDDATYTQLKEALVRSFGKSTASKQAELIGLAENPSLGDLKPSDYLHKIRNLSDCDYKAVERALFLHAMPESVRTALADAPGDNVALSLRADVVHEELRIARSRASGVQVQACSPSPPMSEASGPVASSPMNQVNAMSRSPSSKLCNLHRKFGFGAFHCRGGDCPLRNEPLAVSPKTPSSQTKTRSGNKKSGR